MGTTNTSDLWLTVLSQSGNNSSNNNNSITSNNYKNVLCFNWVSWAFWTVNYGSLRRVQLLSSPSTISYIYIFIGEIWLGLLVSGQAVSALNFCLYDNIIIPKLPLWAFNGLTPACPFSLLLRSLTLNTTVQMHLNRSEWKRRVTSLLKNVGLPYHKDTSLIYGQLLVNHNSLNLSVRLFFKLVNLQCARDCSFPDKRDTLPLPSLQLHGVPVSSCLHAAQVPWTSILWTALIKHLV